jgi:hypothetical protein
MLGTGIFVSSEKTGAIYDLIFVIAVGTSATSTAIAIEPVTTKRISHKGTNKNFT